MNTRLGWATAAALFAASVALAAADLWLPAVAVLSGPAYLAGRWDRRRDRLGAFVVLRGDLDWARARIAALEDEQVNRWDTTHPAPPVVARPDWPSRNRNTASRDASPSYTTPA